VVITDEGIGVSQLLGARAQAAPLPKSKPMVAVGLILSSFPC